MISSFLSRIMGLLLRGHLKLTFERSPTALIKKKVEELFYRKTKKTGFAAWLLLFYALWHNFHIMGNKDVDGNVFDILNESKK